jgi:hypothetical protein
MSNYTKSTDFAAKDALASGNASKIVKGTEIDTEFNNIATAVSTKADLASPTFTGTPALPTGTTAVTQLSNDDSTKLATTAFVQDVADAVKQALYPVGSIYTNATNSTNPATLLGFGTWTAFAAGRVMVGLNAGDPLFDTAEETGGSANSIAVSHTHTADTAGNHQHFTYKAVQVAPTGVGASNLTNSNYAAYATSGGTDFAYGIQASGSEADVGLTSTAGSHTHTINSAGSSGTNANYQPYITVYMWKRTA